MKHLPTYTVAWMVFVLAARGANEPQIITSNNPSAPAKSAVELFSVGEVRLLDSPFKKNMERNADYLLSLDPDRLLHNTRQYCGLEPKGPLYGGWESRGIAGHTLGHYLSAISEQYAATGDKRFRDRLDYIIGEMAECQKLYGDGYIGALPPLELATLRGLKNGKVELQGNFGFKGGAWVPWYTEHKVLAGLKDAWLLGGSEKAKEVTLALADWVDDITAKLSPEDQQKMLGVEFGGMNETLVDLYAHTGNPRYLETSQRFYHKAVMDPLAAGKDELPGKHANTQIPKVIGEARRYEVTGEENGRKIAENFWNLVVNRYTFALGGNSDREHFFPATEAANHLGPETAETCNVYNMLKLTEHLMEWKPEVIYGDYYERALYNDILPSQEPLRSMFTYFVSLKPGHFRTYSSPDNSFWCCVGTGMENHTKYGEAIYFHNAEDLYVNLFIPSELNWKEKGLLLRQKNNYPQTNETELTVEASPASEMTMHIRCPAWATAPLRFQLNDEPLAVEAKPGEFAEIKRRWKQGDRLRITIPMSLRTEALIGAPDKLALFYGPVLLAGDFGRVPDSQNYPNAGEHQINDRAPTAKVPTLVVDNHAALLEALHPVPGEPLTFRTEGIGKPDDVTLRPFNAMPYEYYNVYWDVVSPAAWQKREAEMVALAAQRSEEEARIVDEMLPGEQQSEVDHGLKSERSETGDFRNRKWRDAKDGGYFSFQLKALRDTPQILRCTYWGDDAGNRTFDILVNNEHLAKQTLEHNKPGQFFDVDYAIPASRIGEDKIVVRFQPQAGQVAGGVFRCALIKATP